MAVDGLYGHMRRNNTRSVMMIGSFLLFYQILVVMYFKWLPMMMLLKEQWRTGIDQHITNPSMSKLVGPLFGGSLSSTFGNLSGVAKTASYVPVGDPPGGLDALVAMFKYANLFDGIWLAITAFAVVYLTVSIGWSSLIVRRITGAVPLQRNEFPDLYNLVENLSTIAGIPCPKIELIDSPKLNAYATGLTVSSGRIGLTRGMLSSLTRDELAAVIGHELTHIKNGDTRLLIVARACFGFLLPSVDSWAKALKENPAREMTRAFVVAAALAWFLGTAMIIPFAATGLLVFLLLMVFNILISQSREYIADAGSIELSKNPMALTSALRKIEMADDLDVSGFAVKSMLISGNSEGWFATHPPMQERVGALIRHGGMNHGEYDIVTAKLTPGSAMPYRSDSGAGGFGQRGIEPVISSQTGFGQAGLEQNNLGQNGIGAHGPLFGAHSVQTRHDEVARNVFDRQPDNANWVSGLQNMLGKSDAMAGKVSGIWKKFFLFVMLPVWGFGLLLSVLPILFQGL